MPDPRTLSIGVIGMGSMGTRHAVNLHRHVGAARVAAVYDVDPQRASTAAAECGSPRVVADPFALIQDDGVDAVIIASPDATHVPYVLECVRCQKPVLCEKPLATRAADAAKVVAAECDLGRRLISVGFMRRFDPQHVAVNRVSASGEIGRPILFKGVHRNPTIPYATSADVVITNSASHDIDAARWLLGQEIQEVYVRGVRTRSSFSADTLDLLMMQMVLSGNCLASVEVYVVAEYGYEVSAELVAERGTVVTMQPDYALVRARQTRSSTIPMNWLDRFQDAYVAELTQWIHSVQTNEAFGGAAAWDGYMALLATDACIESIRSGTPVPVVTPDRPTLYAT